MRRIAARHGVSVGTVMRISRPFEGASAAGVAEDPRVASKSALLLATLRSHNQYNTTIYNLDDRYRRVFGGRMVIFMNDGDMADRGITAESLVDIEALSDDGQKRIVRGFKVKPYRIPRGSVGAYYPETNPLLPLSHHDVQSKCPAAKSIPVLVTPHVAEADQREEPHGHHRISPQNPTGIVPK